MKIKSIQIKNFGSLKDVDLNFSDIQDGVIAIVGENGEGKSLFFECIFCALYGFMPERNFKLSDIVSNDNNLLKVNFDYNNKSYESNITIKGNDIFASLYSVNGIGEILPLNDGKISTFKDKAIEDFGDPNLFLTTAYTTQSGSENFLNLSRIDRKKLFIKLLGLDKLEEKSNKAKENAKYHKIEIDKVQYFIDQYKNINFSEEIGELEKEVMKNVQVILEFGGKADKLNDEIIRLEKEKNLLENKTTDNNDFKLEFNLLDNKINQLVGEIEDIKEFKSKIDSINCNRNDCYLLNKEKEKIKLLDIKNNELSKLKEKKVIIEKDQKEKESKEKEETSKKYNEINNKIRELRNEFVSIEQLKKQAIRNDIINEQKIKDYKYKILQLEEKQQELKETQNEYNEWNLLSNILSKNGIQALEIDQSLPRITNIANELLKECFSNRYSIELFTENKGKTEDFDIKVYDGNRLDMKVQDINMFSGGQKAIISEALALAITIYNKEKNGIDIKTLIRDEVTSSLSEDNAINYINMLKKVRKLGNFNHVLFVVHNQEVIDRSNYVLTVKDGEIK